MKDYKIGAISVRVSTDMQTKYSPDSQIKMCLEYAKKNKKLMKKTSISSVNEEIKIKIKVRNG